MRARFTSAPLPDFGDATLARLTELSIDETRRRRLLTGSVVAALALHVLLVALVPRPADEAPSIVARREWIRLAATPRFLPPPTTVTPPAPRTRRIPMPDPTPDALEPIAALRSVEPDLAFRADDALLGIPEAPPAPEPTIYEVGGEVSAPEKLYAPDPAYPRAALLARRGGTVIVEATIDRSGRVTAIRALTDRGFGLEEAALAAVAEWRFRPGLRRGEPVPVLYRLTVNFAVAN